MKQMFSPEGWRALAGSWVLLGLSILASAGIVLGSEWYRERERREGAATAQRLQQARTRLESARR
jgi:hypothetical protein